MRLAALVLATLIVSASALPALADCLYHQQTAKQEAATGSGGQTKVPAEEGRG